MKIILIKTGAIFFIIASIMFISAKDESSTSNKMEDNNPSLASDSLWHVIDNTYAVKVYVSKIICSGNEYYVFRFKNTSSDTMQIAWNWHLQYMDSCSIRNSNPIESNQQNLILNPNQNLYGDCNSLLGTLTLIRKLSGEKGFLSRYKLNNISCSKK